ncbi:MAG: c-type cytochrome [Bacteroidota bacterium]
MKTFFSISLFAFILYLAVGFDVNEVEISPSTSLAEVLVQLGDTPVPHLPKEGDSRISLEAGKNLVLYGNVNGKTSVLNKRQSKHFVCTSCHNVVKDDPDLSNPNPVDRLEYAKANGIPFLQGTSLYGAVNRTSFYNDDYEKKYGDLVKPARNDLREAIQLCAVECSQGRALKDWEMESVLSYLWSLELKLEDLNITKSEMAFIKDAVNGKGEKGPMLEYLKKKYPTGAPAHFVDPPPNRNDGIAYKGNPENGKWIYELSCQHCHENRRYAHYNLDDSKFTFKHLDRHITRYTRYSIYQVARYGTSPKNFKRAYMPQYSKEKMTEEQLEDLRAYIEMRAK